MGVLEWTVTAAVVFAGSVLQSITGMGLGLLIGPVLILTMDSPAAITVAVVLNLLVSVVLLPKEIKDIDTGAALPLLGGCVLGIPVGQWILIGADLATLKLLAGIGVTVAALQMLRSSAFQRRRGRTGNNTARAGHATSVTSGLAAGIMTACLAMPGPPMMWAMGRLDLGAKTIRANLRLLFTAAYIMALVSHLLAGVQPAHFATEAMALSPPLLAGAVLGHYAKNAVSEKALRVALEIILLVMGLALLISALSQ